MYYEERDTWWGLWSKRILIGWGLIDVINNVFGTSVGSVVNRLLIRIFPILVITIPSILISLFLLPDIPIIPEIKVVRAKVDIAPFEDPVQLEERHHIMPQSMKPEQVGKDDDGASKSELSEQPSPQPPPNTSNTSEFDNLLPVAPVAKHSRTKQKPTTVPSDQNITEEDIVSPLKLGPPSKRRISPHGYEQEPAALASEEEQDFPPDIMKGYAKRSQVSTKKGGGLSEASRGTAIDTITAGTLPFPQSSSKSKRNTTDITITPRESPQVGSPLTPDQVIPFPKKWIEKYLRGHLKSMIVVQTGGQMSI